MDVVNSPLPPDLNTNRQKSLFEDLTLPPTAPLKTPDTLHLEVEPQLSNEACGCADIDLNSSTLRGLRDSTLFNEAQHATILDSSRSRPGGFLDLLERAREHILHFTETLLNQKEELIGYRVEPRDPHAVSNPNERLHHAFGNGIFSNAGSREDQAKWITEITGSDLLVQPNKTEGLKDIWNAVVGFVSPWLGSFVEHDAVQRTKEYAKSVLADPNAVLVETRHSQGAIILANALYLLRSEFFAEQRDKYSRSEWIDQGLPETQKKWRDMAARIHIITFGAAAHDFPKEIVETGNVHSFAHRDDWIARLTSTISKWIPLYKTRSGSYVEPTVLPVTDFYKGSHSLESYRADFAKFLIAEYRNEHTPLAGELIRSIQGGYFTDAVHDEVIGEIIAKNDCDTRAFAEAMLDAARSHQLGNFRLLPEHLDRMHELMRYPLLCRVNRNLSPLAQLQNARAAA